MPQRDLYVKIDSLFPISKSNSLGIIMKQKDYMTLKLYKHVVHINPTHIS